MIDASMIQGILIGGAIVGVCILFKTRDPNLEAEIKRGENDAREFHKKGVNIWEIKGFVRTRQATGTAGPYEEGMEKYVNEVLKVKTR